MRKASQEDREDDHERKGLEQCPEGSECGLSVADLYVAPSQEKEKVSVSPEIAEFETETRSRPRPEYAFKVLGCHMPMGLRHAGRHGRRVSKGRWHRARVARIGRLSCR